MGILGKPNRAEITSNNIQKSFGVNDISIEKAKYIRREGTPGNYKYIYKEGEGKKKNPPVEAKENKPNEGKLSNKEIAAINNYTSSGYRRLNRDLREGNKLDPRQVEQVNMINNALDKLPEEKGVVFRGMSIPADINSMLNEWKKGGTVKMDSFTSTSQSKSVAQNFGAFQMEIKSKTGRNISKLSQFEGEESEVLFKTEAKFKVKSIKVNKYKDPFLGEVVVGVNVKLEEV